MAKHGRDKTRKSDKPALSPQPRSDAPAPASSGSPAKDLLRRPQRRRRAPTDCVEIAGLVVDAFGRRFTLEADGARTLVDLGRRGAALVALAAGSRPTIIGRRKDGEFKAWSLREESGREHVLRKPKQVKRYAAANAAPAAVSPA